MTPTGRKPSSPEMQSLLVARYGGRGSAKEETRKALLDADLASLEARVLAIDAGQMLAQMLAASAWASNQHKALIAAGYQWDGQDGYTAPQETPGHDYGPLTGEELQRAFDVPQAHTEPREAKREGKNPFAQHTVRRFRK